ncbi:MAG: hypothetical protein ACUVTG_10865 [Candidatus Oleimicrobiaceae bacterium]
MRGAGRLRRGSLVLQLDGRENDNVEADMAPVDGVLDKLRLHARAEQIAGMARYGITP